MPHFQTGRLWKLFFPCQFRQIEIEFCQDENQDRVNEFQFRFREKIFRQCETEFCQKENDFCQIRNRELKNKNIVYLLYFRDAMETKVILN